MVVFDPSNKLGKRRRKDKDWTVKLKSGRDFQELEYGTLEIKAEGYHTKTATVIHNPARVSAPSPQPDVTPLQPSTIKLKLGSVTQDIIPAESISLEIKDMESITESSLTVDNKDNTTKITIHKPLPKISEDALLDRLRQLLEEKGIDNPGPNERILEKLTNHDLWKEDTPVEEPVAVPPQERRKFYEAVMLIRQAFENTSHYDGMESDIESLSRIIERTENQNGTVSSDDQELLRNLMNWGANFYSEKEIEQTKKDVWEVFEETMHNLLGILVIYRHRVPFNSKDHLRFEGSDTRGATVERVIRPGFKVSAIAENGQKGLVLEKAHVITGKSG